MLHVENIADRVDALLLRVVKGTEQRDHILSEVSALLKDHSTLQPILKEINETRYQQLPAYVEKAATLARTLERSASLADRSSRNVKRLDTLLSRVEATKAMTEAMLSMGAKVQEAPRTLAAGDLDRTVELINDYQSARRVLTGGRDAHEPVPSSPSVAVSALIEETREKARAQLITSIEAAVASNDKLTMMKSTSLLAQLGYGDEGLSRYCAWLCDHTIAALKKMVARELRIMDDPTSAAISHLSLVSRALDTVAAAYEAEEEFMRDTFGREGPKRLLMDLHQRSTAQCVPVLRDFLDKRQYVLTTVQRLVDTDRLEGVSEDDNGHDQRPQLQRSSRAQGRQHRGGLSAAQHEQRSIDASIADSRRADEILEETSHLVSCCHIYLQFAESKLKENTDSASVAGGAAAAVGHDAESWATHNNELLDAVQDVLAMYVPLQSGYFQLAFRQALRLQKQAVQHVVQQAEQELQKNAARAGAAPQALMVGLSNMYAAALGDGGGDVDTEEEGSVYYAGGGAVTLPDDVFFFLRLAVHRSLNTRSTQVASAIVISALDVMQTLLIPEITKRAVLHRNKGPPPPPPGALRWANAGHQTVDYSKRLAEEIRQLAEKTYKAGDVARFRELAQDIDVIAQDLNAALQSWLEGFATLCVSSVQGKHLERLAAVSYVMTEEVFYHYELNDPWVQSFLEDCSCLLDYVGRHLETAACYDTVLTSIATNVMASIRQTLSRKHINAYGALQVDKDVRALRSFFLERARECSLRETFAVLSLISTLLLSDTPRDALEEVHNTALAPEEKRAVLLTRVDLNRHEVLSLPL